MPMAVFGREGAWALTKKIEVGEIREGFFDGEKEARKGLSAQSSVSRIYVFQKSRKCINLLKDPNRNLVKAFI